MIVRVRHRQSSKEGVHRGSREEVHGKRKWSFLCHGKAWSNILAAAEFLQIFRCAGNNRDGGSSLVMRQDFPKNKGYTESHEIFRIACDVYPLLFAPWLRIRCLLGWILRKILSWTCSPNWSSVKPTGNSRGNMYPWVMWTWWSGGVYEPFI